MLSLGKKPTQGGAVFAVDSVVSSSDFSIDVSTLTDELIEKLGPNHIYLGTAHEGVLIRSGGDIDRYTNSVHALMLGDKWDVASAGANSLGAVYRDSLRNVPKILAAAAGTAYTGFTYARANSDNTNFTHGGWNGGSGSAGRINSVAGGYDYQWGNGFNYAADADNKNATFVNSLRAQTLATLPVSLTSFNAKAELRGNVLQWSTSREVNHSHFEIYRSSDKQNFSLIGSITKANNGLKNYEFIDRNFFTGINYYKLRQVDLSGSFEDLDIKAVKNTLKDSGLETYVLEEAIIVKFEADRAEEVIVSLRDVSGRSLDLKAVKVNKGDNTIELKKVSGSGVHVVLLKKKNGEHLVSKIVLN